MSDKPNVFAIDRRSWDHPVFAKEPFTEWQAWAWLISEAAWKARRYRTGNHIINLKRGQVSHSVRYMAEAWQWSKSKVHRFLNRLKSETLVRTESGTGITIITICNYDKYQVVGVPSETDSEPDSGTGAGQQRDRKETGETGETKKEKNTKKEKEKSPRQELERILSHDVAGAVVEHRNRLRKPLTPRAARLLAGKFARCRDPDHAADQMIVNGWQGFEPEWIENRKGQEHGTYQSGSQHSPTAQERAQALLEEFHSDYQRRH